MGPLNLIRATIRLLPKSILASGLLASTLLAASPSYAVDSDLYLAGLGLHQETGRNIYLGGIYLEREAQKPQDLTATAGERVMEYRVVARRTSIRSLLGGMLLQSEVATGNPPDKATADFVDGILSTVNTSLYAGDSLEIRLTQNNETLALLNGHELARIRDKSVADYLLMGWVGESGPSTTFRNKITAEEVDPSLLSALEANTYSEKRRAEIASWLGSPQPQAAASAKAPPVADDSPAAAASNAEIAESGAATEVAEEDPTPSEGTDLQATTDAKAKEVSVATKDSGFTISVVDAPVDSAEQAAAEENNSLELIIPNTGPLQLASLSPVIELPPLSPLEREVQALGIQEYSQRLSHFHSDMIGKVYAAIRYPKRAVRRGLEGRLELDITMTASGKILDVAIAMPSGHNLLDDAAVDAALKAFGNSVPAIDPVAVAEFGDFETEELTVPVPVSFQLQ